MHSYRTLFRQLFVATALIMFGLSAVAQTLGDGFEPLFNGKDLTGWIGDPELWRVENGEIVGSTENKSIPRNQFLRTEKSFSDFVLRVKVKLRNHNSGIQFRSEAGEGYVVTGYQADVAEQTYYGMLYEEGKRGFMPYWRRMSDAEKRAVQSVVRQGDWNQFEITCRGDEITLALNRYLTCNIVDPDGARAGVIALQLHTGAPMEVRFKDIEIKDLSPGKRGLLMPDYDSFRRERLTAGGARYRTPEGFSIEEVATNDLIGSVINMTFDHLGRPTMASERGGIRILLDENGDGLYEAQKSFSENVRTAMGLHWLAPGDLLVQAQGPKGPGLYRVTDTNGDQQADIVQLIGLSNGGMGEHGPHTILSGPDSFLYILYGNHAHPAFALDPWSPSRGLKEDHLLPRYVDPRGHAVNIRAPGGTIQRFDPVSGRWSELVAGFRNPYDMAANDLGEIFLFEADMEWDFRLPWYRPIRVIHAIPGGDYGWRTGSSKMPFYYIDTLPSVDDVGRGSPVGVAFYYHDVYPEAYYGAFFMGDWSRGRIRVIFPEKFGATYTGRTTDFVLGEPLAVTDLDIGPDGFLYYTIGGRNTTGGLFRVRFDGPRDPENLRGAQALVRQPMPRSAWGAYALAQAKESLGERRWARQLNDLARSRRAAPADRYHALELLQVYGPKPEIDDLIRLARDNAWEVRAAAIFLLGIFPLAQVEQTLITALSDPDPFVARRACEALIRAGLDAKTMALPSPALVPALFALLDHEDRFLRYAARLALMRTHRHLWAPLVLADSITTRPRGALEGVLALIFTQESREDSDAVFTKLQEFDAAAMDPETLLNYLRVVGLAFLRDTYRDTDRSAFVAAVGPRLLSRFPTGDWRVNRELQVVLAHMEFPGTVPALLAYLTPEQTQEEQIHTVYVLRTIENGWQPEQRNQLVEWFKSGWNMAGGASMEGYINNLWQSTLEILPEEERWTAAAMRNRFMAQRQEQAAALMAKLESEQPVKTDLAQMSFEELADYLEYDPMSYREPNLAKGREVFIRARCVQCHIFGSIGQGGGPDLSTVTSRFRRRDILESIVYPSRVISDQYTALTVELKDFSEVTGMVVGENDATLTLITVHGERVEIAKEQVTSRRESESSVMPEGLLNTMTLGELVELMHFLERGADL